MTRLVKHINFRLSGALAVIGLLALSQIAGWAASHRTKQQIASDKSDYIFMEALSHEATDSFDAYFELLNRAYQLNPSDLFVGYDYGLYEVSLFHQSDSIRRQHGVDLMKRYVMQSPDDLESGLRLASMLTKLGDTEEALDVYRMLYKNSDNPRVTGAAYASALAYSYNTDSVKKAILIIDSLEKYDGVTMDLIGWKLKYYNVLDDTASILSETSRLLGTSPRSVDYILLSGDINMQFGRPDSALVYYNRALDVDPTNGYAVYKRAVYYHEIGDSVSFDKEIFQAMKMADLDVESKLSILQGYVADLYADSLQRPRIISLFNTLVDQYPHQEQVRGLYGSYLYSIGDKPGAADQYSYAVSLNPDNKDLWVSLSQIYYLNNQYDKSNATVKDALRYFPDDVDLYLLGSSAAMQAKDFDAAFAYLDKALLVTDTTDVKRMADIYGAIGDVAYQKEDTEKAWKAYKTALGYNPESSMLLNNIAYYMACESIDLDTALEYIERSLDIEKTLEGENRTTTLDTYAWVLFKMKQYPKALEVINQVLELDEEESSADVFEHAGDIYFMNGNPSEALEYWKKALELDPDSDLLKRKVKHKTFFFE